MTEPDKASERDPFYVGYFPMPKPIKRFILPWLVGNLVLAIGIAVVIASQDREPGDGVWETNKAVEVFGRLIHHPYPMLRTEQGETYLLVEQGKIGAQARLEKLLDRRFATVTGYLIEREGRKVLEIDSSLEEPVVTYIGPPKFDERGELQGILATAIIPAPHRTNLGTYTLTGEIVDPKCYLGVMQPGEGKTHKACATLCIKGGIPPMFLVRNKQGNTAAYLLTDAEGNAFPESHHEYIADPIELTGEVFRDGDLLTLRADLDSIRRLD